MCGDPIQEAATLESFASGLVVHLEPAATDTGLNADADGPPGVVPVDGARPPPLADFLGKDGERGNGVNGHSNGDGDDAGGAHGCRPLCVRSAPALQSPVFTVQNN